MRCIVVRTWLTDLYNDILLLDWAFCLVHGATAYDTTTTMVLVVGRLAYDDACADQTVLAAVCSVHQLYRTDFLDRAEVDLPPVRNDIAAILRRMQPRWQRYRGTLPCWLLIATRSANMVNRRRASGRRCGCWRPAETAMEVLGRGFC